MSLLRLTTALLVLAGALAGEEVVRRPAPFYTSASLVNAATNLPGTLAPNTIASLYGTGLAYVTRAVSSEDLRGEILPLVLAGTGVRVSIGEVPAHIYYVSPTQVNLLIPSNLLPGPAELQLTLDGRAGPAVRIELAAAAPALFLLNERWIIACRADGSVITEENPARSGEIVILYATGLGRTVPNPRSGELPRRAAPLERLAEFDVLLDGEAVGAARLLYAGVAPGFAGLYQINLRLPEPAPPNPQVRLRLGDLLSPASGRLPLIP